MDIDKIILKVLNRKASAEEYKILEEWKKESAENLKYIRTLAPEGSTGTHYENFNESAAWRKVNNEISSPARYLWWAVAALIIALLIGVIYTRYLKEDPYPRVHMAEAGTKKVALADNSIVHLNNNAALHQLNDFTTERKVRLEGEAFFEIHPDPSAAFIIALDDQDYIKVIGTSFNLINRENDFDLTVFSGKVELRTLNRSIILEKNDRVRKIDEAYVKIVNRDPNLLSWQTGRLIFDNTSLNNVFADLEKHYGFSYIVNGEPAMSECRLTSQFNGEDFTDILSELDKIFEMDYRFENDTLEIYSLKCK